MENKHHSVKLLLKRFHLNAHTKRFHPELRTKSSESSAQEVLFEWSHRKISSADSNVRYVPTADFGSERVIKPCLFFQSSHKNSSTKSY